MSEREFVIYLDQVAENRYRHRHVWERGELIEFRIQYEALIGGQWHAIVRYDTAHEAPHRDILQPDGMQIKEFYPGYSKAEILTIGQRDILRNWARYRAQYEQEMTR